MTPSSARRVIRVVLARFEPGTFRHGQVVPPLRERQSKGGGEASPRAISFTLPSWDGWARFLLNRLDPKGRMGSFVTWESPVGFLKGWNLSGLKRNPDAGMGERSVVVDGPSTYHRRLSEVVQEMKAQMARRALEVG
jgi:hypothetical protein